MTLFYTIIYEYIYNSIDWQKGTKRTLNSATINDINRVKITIDINRPEITKNW